MFFGSNTRSMVSLFRTPGTCPEKQATLSVKPLTISIAHLLPIATCVLTKRKHIIVFVDRCFNFLQHATLISIADK